MTHKKIILEALHDYQTWFDEEDPKFKEIQRAIDEVSTNGSDLVNKKFKKYGGLI